MLSIEKQKDVWDIEIWTRSFLRTLGQKIPKNCLKIEFTLLGSWDW